MLDLPSVRTFRLSRGGVECDEQGLRVGHLALLARDGRGAWKVRDERNLGHDLSHVYGFRLDARAKMAGFGVVAKALQDGNLAKAQIAALLLRLPAPPLRTDAALGKSAERRLYYDLVACGLLKADADWDEKHPRTGSPPNRARFASKPGDAGADEPPKADAKPDQDSSSGAEAPRSQFAFLSTGAAKAAESVLAEDLPDTVLKGLATLAARVSAASIIFGAIFIPSATPSVDEGPVPGRPNMRYRWAHAGSEVTFDALVDGQWRRLTTGQLRTDTGLFYDNAGEIVARLVHASDSDRRWSPMSTSSIMRLRPCSRATASRTPTQPQKIASRNSAPTQHPSRKPRTKVQTRSSIRNASAEFPTDGRSESALSTSMAVIRRQGTC
jgi:hypothetical protein